VANVCFAQVVGIIHHFLLQDTKHGFSWFHDTAFATKNCALCAKERIAILKQSKSNPQHLVNSNNCRQRARSHGHAKQTSPNADESINDERASH